MSAADAIPGQPNRAEDDLCLAILNIGLCRVFYVSSFHKAYMHGFRNEDTLGMTRSDIGSRDKSCRTHGTQLPADLAQPQLYFGKEQSGQIK